MKQHPPNEGLTRRDLFKFVGIGTAGLILVPGLNLFEPRYAHALPAVEKLDTDLLCQRILYKSIRITMI